MELFGDSFSKAFNGLLAKTGVSCYKIAQYTDLDEAYLSRLRNGDKRNPSIETIIKISLALARFSDKAELEDIEYLFRGGQPEGMLLVRAKIEGFIVQARTRQLSDTLFIQGHVGVDFLI